MNGTKNMQTYYTVEQVAELLTLHPKTIQRYIREGRLPAKKIGKSWRITAHDLSVFAEQTEACSPHADTDKRPEDKVLISSVVDIQIDNFEQGVRISNMLTAAMNGKPSLFGKSAMHVQHLQYENKVRISLWGTIAFIQAMLELISTIMEQAPL